ncbi:hypothetical protein, partial [Enterobacter roggenkampii]|uniref:hypothetical protein n=1 Tax=Enterobacter roggenkampii TaxID=1812935 RepID=UPI00403F99BB
MSETSQGTNSRHFFSLISGLEKAGLSSIKCVLALGCNRYIKARRNERAFLLGGESRVSYKL